jgi:sulfate transport system ATP-binding protein
VLGGLEVAYPQHPHDESRAATAFVRSHELDILRTPDGRPNLAARVIGVNTARAVVKVRLRAEDFGVTLHVDLTPDRWSDLGLSVGEDVYVSPTNVRLFVRDYAI